ncbi:MAG: DUF4838 domain-containing protein [Planctomycetes bacterium]|nr:DUF4838 domain-containing protein [Planctomycetota bacterium]
MRLHMALVTAASLLLLAVAVVDGDLILVDDGTPKASIVIPGSPSPTEQFAAEELQKYIEQMSGARLPIVPDQQKPEGTLVSVGKTKLATVTVPSQMPSPDPYIIKTVDRSLILLGKGDRGTIYSVYWLLEKHLGCRWVFPGPLGDIVPKKRSITVGELDESYEPDFRFRICAGFNPPACIDWAIKQRMQLYSPSPKMWAKEDMIKRGGFVKGTMHHAFHRLFPAEQYFKEHPEYYGLFRGKRTASPSRGQLCLSNPEVVRLTTEKANRFFEEHPDAEFFSLCPDDNMNWCECENCRAFDSTTMERWGRTFPVVTDRLMAFVNQVAEGLEKKHPGKMIYTFAYQNYTDPPLKYMPRKNVIISLCHMVPACYAHPLKDPDCEKNVAFMKLLTGWTKIHKNMWYYAYTCKSMWQDMPWPIARRLAKDIRTLHAQGFQGFYSQGSGMRWGQLGVNMVLMTKLLWDVDTDVEAVLDDYFRSSFGPAADAMKSYYNLLEKEFSQPGIYIHHEAREQAPQFLTAGVFAKCFGYLDAAEKAAAGDEKILARIKPVRIAFEYARLYLEADRYEKAFKETDSDDDLKKAVQTYLKIVTLQKEHGAHAISYGGVNRYVKGPLAKLQVEQFARTGEAEGLSIKWDTENLLKNPSFEDNADGKPAEWLGLGPGPRGSAALTDERAHTGKGSLVMQAKKDTKTPDETGFYKADWIAVSVLSPKIPVKKGDIYRLMAWINIPEPFTDTKRGVALGLIGYDEKGESPVHWRAGNIEVRRMKRTDGWQRLAIFRKIDDPKIKSIAIRLGIAGTGKVFIDDIELVKGEETK